MTTPPHNTALPAVGEERMSSSLQASPSALASTNMSADGEASSAAVASQFADVMFEYWQRLSQFEDALCEHLSNGDDYSKLGGDDYDCSLEIYGATPDLRLNEAAQRLISENGFVKVYVNHTDGWQTHYSWDWRVPFQANRGWRVVYGSTPRKISFWPTSWTGSVHLRPEDHEVVPDPVPSDLPLPDTALAKRGASPVIGDEQKQARSIEDAK